MEDIFIPVLLGTTREGRKSYFAAKLVTEVGANLDGVKTLLVDPKKFNFPQDGNNDGDQDPKYEELVGKADGFFIVTPEYNHGYPPSLKRMLDSENDFSHYQFKPVVIAGVSNGPWGGVRVIEALLPVVRALNMYALSKDMHFTDVNGAFNEKGAPNDNKVYERIKRVFKELVWVAKVLKEGKKAVPQE